MGDHDINPGNLIVVKTNDNINVTRIDFGHAFYDLAKFNHCKTGVFVEENHVLTFFNLAQFFIQDASWLDNVNQKSLVSKLWRDYPGMMPCEELAEALQMVTSVKEEKIKEAIQKIHTEFSLLTNNFSNIALSRHIYDALLMIYKKNGGKTSKISKQDPFGKGIACILTYLGEMFKHNCTDAAEVSKLMSLQCFIDDMLMTNIGIDTQAVLDAIGKNECLKTVSGQTEIAFIKLTDYLLDGRSKQAFKGSLEAYINERKEKLLDNKRIPVLDRIIHGPAIFEKNHTESLQKHNRIPPLFTRLKECLKNKEFEKAEQIIVNIIQLNKQKTDENEKKKRKKNTLAFDALCLITPLPQELLLSQFPSRTVEIAAYLRLLLKQLEAYKNSLDDNKENLPPINSPPVSPEKGDASAVRINMVQGSAGMQSHNMVIPKKKIKRSLSCSGINTNQNFVQSLAPDKTAPKLRQAVSPLSDSSTTSCENSESTDETYKSPQDNLSKPPQVVQQCPDSPSDTAAPLGMVTGTVAVIATLKTLAIALPLIGCAHPVGLALIAVGFALTIGALIGCALGWTLYQTLSFFRPPAVPTPKHVEPVSAISKQVASI